MSTVAGDMCPTIGLPYLNDESELDTSAKLKPKHRLSKYLESFTRDLNASLLSPSGLHCIASEGLDGFTSCFPRLKSFLEARTSSLAMIILLQGTSDPDDEGVDLIDGELLDDRYTNLIHQDELLNPQPSRRTKMLLKAWHDKQFGKRNERGEARATRRNQY